MQKLPVADPKAPDLRSPDRFIQWIAREHRVPLAAGTLWGCLWMVTLGVTPFVIGQVIDRIVARDTGGAIGWAIALLGLSLLTALGSTMRHRCDTFVRLGATYRIIQLVTRQVARTGAGLVRPVARGEVVAISTTDVGQVGNLLETVSRSLASVVAIVVVAVILLLTSWPVGLLVLIGVPALLFGTGFLLKPIQVRADRRRDQQAVLTANAADIVAGLRVLRGIGGEDVFADRYRAESQQVRRSGVHLARLDSVLQQSGSLLPGLLAVGVVWLGAALAQGGNLSIGELVSFYSYAAFLALPMNTAGDLIYALSGGRVAARRIVDVLSLQPLPEGATISEPAGDPELVDPSSGLVVRAGRLTAVAAADPVEALALAERLGRYVDSEARYGGVPLADRPTAWVRERILVVDHRAHLFSGTLADQFGDASPERVSAALHSANGEDIVAALPDGLDTRVGEGGLTFSGGEKQRLQLARALLADPPVLVLVEPTSAVDASTEALIADRVRTARGQRTTVVVSTSPLVLDRADDVAFLADGKVVKIGSHRELLETVPAYAQTTRRSQS